MEGVAPHDEEVARTVIRGFDGSRLRRARTALRLSIPEVAREGGISPSTLRRWESGASTPQVDTLAAVMAVLSTPIAEVVRVPPDERLISDWRTLAGLLQVDLARELEVKEHVVNDLERGLLRNLPDDLARSLGHVLGITHAEVMRAWRRGRERPAAASKVEKGR